MTILDRIAEAKRKEVAIAKKRRPIEQLTTEIESQDPPRDFLGALTGPARPGIRLIAEIKKASPSAGVIVPNFDPVQIARTYYEHGASALSVLTDEGFFQGRLSYIGEVKRAVPLPVLRKDFLVDSYQVYQSRAAGADAILLIAELLDVTALGEMASLARRLKLAVLVEVHTEQNLERILDALGPPGAGRYILGINNRDLKVQKTDLATTPRLAAMLPKGTPFVSESGITTRDDVLEVQRAGARAILVGESLLRTERIGDKIDELLGGMPNVE